jgi:hypothetical protein
LPIRIRQHTNCLTSDYVTGFLPTTRVKVGEIVLLVGLMGSRILDGSIFKIDRLYRFCVFNVNLNDFSCEYDLPLPLL